VFEADKEVLDWHERQLLALTKEFVDSMETLTLEELVPLVNPIVQ
jgi:hypothetical protein